MAERGRPRRFLPGDPRVEEPYRLTPQLALRVAVLGFVALAVFAVLFLRLWALQVLSGTKYRVEASDNRVRTIQIDGAARHDHRQLAATCSSTNTLGDERRAAGRPTCRSAGRPSDASSQRDLGGHRASRSAQILAEMRAVRATTR